jgi:hypothetical protein
MSIEYAIVHTEFDMMQFADCGLAGNLVCHRVVEESSIYTRSSQVSFGGNNINGEQGIKIPHRKAGYSYRLGSLLLHGFGLLGTTIMSSSTHKSIE